MARDRLSSDYSENMSDATTCSCLVSSVGKCSVRSCCSMFQEPFFLHPPGSRPRDGLYINPMSTLAFPPNHRQKDSVNSTSNSVISGPPSSSTNGTGSHSSESFYLHSPHDLVYTRITHLFDDRIVCAAAAAANGGSNLLHHHERNTSSGRSSGSDQRKDDIVTVKVDVHHVNNNNGTLKSLVNGSAAPSPAPSSSRHSSSSSSGSSAVSCTTEAVCAKVDAISSGSEHAYEQICPDELHLPDHDDDDLANQPKYAKIGPPTTTGSSPTATLAASDALPQEPPRSRSKADRRYSKSSSTSESSNLSSEAHYSSATSTPSLSRNSSNERMSRSPKESLSEKKNSSTPTTASLSSTRAESEKESTTTTSNKPGVNGPSFRPPPPPPPPPPELDELVIVTAKVLESGSSGSSSICSDSHHHHHQQQTVLIHSSSSSPTNKNNNNNNNNNNITQEKKCEVTITTTTASDQAGITTISVEPPATTAAEEDHQQRTAALSQPAACTEDAQAAAAAAAHAAQVATVASHLVNRHMVLPFIPPKFVQAADSETLLKPSEYLRSICKATSNGIIPPPGTPPTTVVAHCAVLPVGPPQQPARVVVPSVVNHTAINTLATANSISPLSKARSVDNLDIQGRGVDEEDSRVQRAVREEGEDQEQSSGPPPPPLPPPCPSSSNGSTLSVQASSEGSDGSSKPSQQPQQQPLATISIQDLTSVQLRRTNLKMHATKTFSAPPNRSVSMTNVSETFFVQKTDLIAELKKTKDIPGIKKLKVQRAQVEKSQEQNLISEISKTFSISNFVDQIPEKDSSGNVIPIWKRQMLARKAAERAKKELEEQIARENEEKRQKAIPPWKRQLLAKKDSESKIIPSSVHPPLVATVSAPKLEVTKKDPEPSCTVPASALEEVKATMVHVQEEKRIDVVNNNNNNNISNKNGNGKEDKGDDDDDDDNVHIIPWRAQLRKTNSKLNILD